MAWLRNKDNPITQQQLSPCTSSCIINCCPNPISGYYYITQAQHVKFKKNQQQKERMFNAVIFMSLLPFPVRPSVK